MAKHILRTPLSEEDVAKLRIGDVVYITGLVYTARDATHRMLIEELEKGRFPRELLRGAVVYHAGPVVKRVGNEWRVVSVGPTTSIRMERFIPKLLSLAEIRMIVGKGGLGKSASSLVSRGCVYGVFPGGCGVVAAMCVKRVVDVYYLDELGIPEAMWVLEVENFGPIVITVSLTEGNLHS